MPTKIIKPEVRDRLITGFIQYLSAESSGSGKTIINYAYLAIDNYFSALLIERGIKGIKNHQEKKKKVFKYWKSLFQGANIAISDLDNFYNWWQDVRYSSVVPTPKQSIDFRRLTYKIIDIINSYFADKHGMTSEELEEGLYEEVIGGRWLSFNEHIGRIHEKWQSEAEYFGEMGLGSKLGNKILNPSNFCNIAVFTDDEYTKGILVKNDEIGLKIASFYQSFLKLISSIQELRMVYSVKKSLNWNKIENSGDINKNAAMKSIDESIKSGKGFNEVTNFMLSLQLSYHGQKIEDITKDFVSVFSKVIEQIKKSKDLAN